MLAAPHPLLKKNDQNFILLKETFVDGTIYCCLPKMKGRNNEAKKPFISGDWEGWACAKENILSIQRKG